MVSGVGGGGGSGGSGRGGGGEESSSTHRREQAQSSGTKSLRPQNQPPQTESMSKAIQQYTVDARLHAVFEQSGESGRSFDYSQSLKTTTYGSSVPEQQITAYLSRIQRGGYIQPFGCMIAVDESTFTIIGFSENAREMLGLTPQSVPSLERPEILAMGTDVRSLFTSSSSILLERAFAAREITLLNPVWIHSKYTGKPFYAILHRIDVGVVIDLEPARSEDPALSIAGAVQSQKLAVRAISQLQSLPGGDIKLLCDTVVESVRDLTGYDRVMVYKFHEDEHGEVVAESRREDLEPYIGLHYPATDIPQASRFLFKQNRVRMIVDCHATPVLVVQDDRLTQSMCLVGSTLRAPHGCHSQYMANMGSIASLAMAVIINGSEEDGSSVAGGRSSMRLWGLVVCHHTSSRCIPFPLRYACEFLMQAFGLQLNMELQLALQMSEKRVLRTQTLLCDMLLRDSPAGIVTQSPSIMDLVKCDGAAFLYHGNYYPLGVAPTEAQIKDVVEWLLANHADSTGLSTDSLGDAGYPGAAALGDAVCGMAVAYITKRDFLFWFRSHTAKEIKWGGAKHHPEDKDDGQRMHPRSSFKAFLEVVKSRSQPDENTCCLEWNTALEKLTGWSRSEVIGKMLVGEVFGSYCRLKGPDALTKFMIVLHNAIGGQETDKFPFPFFDRNGKFVQALLTANKRVSFDGKVIGAFCFLQIPSPELQQALTVQRRQDTECFTKAKELAYICQVVKNPLSGLRFTNSLLEATDLNENQKQLLETSVSCEKQISRIVSDMDLERIEDGSFELVRTEFLLGSVINAIVSQAMFLLKERGVQLIRDIPEEIKSIQVYGDQTRIQQLLAEFLLSIIRYAPSHEWVEIHISHVPKQMADGFYAIRTEFRMVCPGEGLPPELVRDMFHSSRWTIPEGLGLSVCRRILKLMNGEVQYIRESERSYFLIILELPVPMKRPLSTASGSGDMMLMMP
ncbi:hypothetical protein F2Q69_00031395 [Brassica cretica]|uniref:Phytochrome n=1 Tax=Brassica cretica TaxID=69181 RepID=A0A8S9RVT7_BRACR|nr:hypothetical protein F2Q69_00031395 [Brassica cretica]